MFFSLSDPCVFFFVVAFSPSSALPLHYQNVCVCSVMLEIHGIQNFFLYIDVKEMNLSEGSTVEVKCSVSRAFWVPICWVYVVVYIYIFISNFPIGLLTRLDYRESNNRRVVQSWHLSRRNLEPRMIAYFKAVLTILVLIYEF